MIFAALWNHFAKSTDWLSKHRVGSKRKRRKLRAARQLTQTPALRQKHSPAPNFPTKRTQFSVTAYMGPIPSADELARYESIEPGLAGRIISMAERQSDHRQRIEAVAVSSEFSNGRLGIFIGAVVAIAALTVTALLGLWGQQLAATAVGVTEIASLASVFVVGSRNRKNERVEKSTQMAQHLPRK
jgi:uncharacterized membrane protein